MKVTRCIHHVTFLLIHTLRLVVDNHVVKDEGIDIGLFL